MKPMQPDFDPESAEGTHHAIFFSGLKERLLWSGEIGEYENLLSALSRIEAPLSRQVIAQFIALLGPASSEGPARIKCVIEAQKDVIRELEDCYLGADEDVPAMLREFYEHLDE